MGIPADLQRLIFAGKPLTTDPPARINKIEGLTKMNAIILCAMRINGG